MGVREARVTNDEEGLQGGELSDLGATGGLGTGKGV